MFVETKLIVNLLLCFPHTGIFTCAALMKSDQLFGPPEFPGLITSATRSRCLYRYIGASGTIARFRLLYFDIPQSQDCSRNNLSVYNGLFATSPLLERLCGTPSEYVFEATGNIMSVYLSTSDFDSTFRGFHGVFESLN